MQDEPAGTATVNVGPAGTTAAASGVVGQGILDAKIDLAPDLEIILGNLSYRCESWTGGVGFSSSGITAADGAFEVAGASCGLSLGLYGEGHVANRNIKQSGPNGEVQVGAYYNIPEDLLGAGVEYKSSGKGRFKIDLGVKCECDPTKQLNAIFEFNVLRQSPERKGSGIRNWWE